MMRRLWPLPTASFRFRTGASSTIYEIRGFCLATMGGILATTRVATTFPLISAWKCSGDPRGRQDALMPSRSPGFSRGRHDHLLHTLNILPGAGIDADFVTRIHEQGHVDDCSRLKRCRLGNVGRGIAAHSWFGALYSQL